MKLKLSFFAAVVAVIVAVATVSVPSEEVKSTEDSYNQKIATFFSMVEQGQHGEAIDFLYADNPWMSLKSDDIVSLRGQFESLTDLLGACVSHSLMHQESFGDRFVYLWYFVATERQPMSFKFQFYRPGDEWLMYSFSYADDVDDLIEERGKIQFCASDLDM